MDRHVVGIVAAPEFGDRLVAFASDKPVWAVDTPSNRRSLPDGRPADHTLAGAITLFVADQDASPAAWCESILGVVVEHHGQYSHNPPVSDLAIVGSEATPALVAALSKYGFSKIVPSETGFNASAT